MRLSVFSIIAILKSPRLLRCAALLGCVFWVACGQKGNLVLPTEAAAANRASLPQSLIPSSNTEKPWPSETAAPSTARP